MTAAGAAVGETALSRAAGGGHALAVDRLLAAGAAVDLAIENGSTSMMHEAAARGHGAVVARLRWRWARRWLRAVDGGATPLFVAAQNGHNAAAARLLAAGAAVDKVSNNQSSQLGMASMEGLLLAAGADVAHKDKYGDDPLSEAVSNGHERAAEFAASGRCLLRPLWAGTSSYCCQKPPNFPCGAQITRHCVIRT